MNLHEHAFVESFVQRTRRERAALALSNAKKRRKLTNSFAHHGLDILEPTTLRSVDPTQHSPSAIYAVLRKLDAPATCHIISEGQFDGQEMELLEALERVVGSGMGTVISCVPGCLGYFEGERRERYILQK